MLSAIHEGAPAAPALASLTFGRRLAAQHQVEPAEVLAALRTIGREVPDAALIVDAAGRLIVELMVRQQQAVLELEAQHRGAAKRILRQPIVLPRSPAARGAPDSAG